MRTSASGRRTSSAVVLYVIILLAFQVFLVTVAVEAFQTCLLYTSDAADE